MNQNEERINFFQPVESNLIGQLKARERDKKTHTFMFFRTQWFRYNTRKKNETLESSLSTQKYHPDYQVRVKR